MGSTSTSKPKRDLVAVDMTEAKMKALLVADDTLAKLPPNKILSDFFICSMCEDVVDEITSVYKMCEAGHLLCYKCHSFVIKCPYEYKYEEEMMEGKVVSNDQFLARDDCGALRPQLCLKTYRVIESKATFYILNHVAFTCKYKDLGCEKKFKCTKISRHERQFCPFRPRSEDALEDLDEVETESDDETEAKKLETIAEEEEDEVNLIEFD